MTQHSMGKVDDSKWTNLISSEQLNSIKYNYGKIVDTSNCCSFQKYSNRLAICTEKCLFIINLNLNWPQTQNSVNSTKFKVNYEKLKSNKKISFTANSVSSTNETTKPSFGIDNWIQDLNDNKDEFLSINLIRSTDKSSTVEKIYKDFFQIEETFKRKPFHRQIRDLVVANKKIRSENSKFQNSTSITEEEELSSENLNLQIVELSIEQYLQHKKISNQYKIYDTNLYDYLSFLNPYNNPNQQTQCQTQFNYANNYFIYGFKYCRWNKNDSLQLLCAINACNQLLLFDCTNLSRGSFINQLPSDLDGKNLSNSATYKKIFDKKSGSSVMNLTEFWLCKYRRTSLLNDTQPKTVDEYLARISQLLPIHLTWSKPFQMKTGISGEFLFVTLKSNEIACFLISENLLDKYEVHLVYLLQIFKNVDSNCTDDEANVSNLLNCIKTETFNSYGITANFFWHENFKAGILTYGCQNGDLYLTDLPLENFNLDQIKSDLKYFKVKNILNIGSIENVKLFKITRIDNQVKLLLVASREISLIFAIIDFNYETNEFFQSEHLPYIYNFNKGNKTDINPNHLIKSFSKLIKFKLMDHHQNTNDIDIQHNFEFWLIFENTQIKHLLVNFSSVDNKIKVTQETMVNNSIELKFNTNEKRFARDHNSQFKMTRQLFFSNDNNLVFQINDFAKSELIDRKITQLELNLYRIKPISSLVKTILPFSKDLINNSAENIDMNNYYIKSNTELTDLLWLFKRNLYLSHDFFDKVVFQSIYANLRYAYKHIKNISFLEIDSGLINYLKRLRILSFYLANYFEMILSFDYLKDQSHFEEKNYLEENDMEDNENESIIDDNEIYKNELDGIIVIRSPSYYWSMFKEISISLFRNYAIRLVNNAFTVGFNELSNKERLVLLLIGEFSIRKSFFGNFEISKEVLMWLENNFLNINATNISDKMNSTNLISLIDQIKCDLCGKDLRIDLSEDLTSIECDSGHTISRCQRSLLPLENFNFKECSKCNSVWNILKDDDYPNLTELYKKKDVCLFCN